MNVKILVATHKKYMMPSSEIYQPIHVGRAIGEDIGFPGDDVGENISYKNPQFCELTALYWAWKNCDYEYIGLNHYRRYFTVRRTHKKDSSERLKSVLNYAEVENLLTSCDVIVPRKRMYFIETLYSHYKNTLDVYPLDVTGEILKDLYPDYYPYFLLLKKKRSGFMFNMFIMRSDILSDYCTWLFDVLRELEVEMGNVDKKYDAFHARYYGRISELLFNVWLEKNKIMVKEVKVQEIEPISYSKKAISMILAKLFNKKYGGSF
ncbi:exopolysaccharide biosynthesis protein [Vreelandella sulfidaeris]|uniref:Exopolysaccharide biosynthesis protein n=1 Tax=Vreelandella sulfidaeris TaxID=115553 RepID=A0A365TX44_9GAMM|nr:DUF4422 domain-containing protein [Halomonas sulfidaeris]RBI69738.1 exopolysaccharide biosynthesis protein [Halomonas sulfidaeris]